MIECLIFDLGKVIIDYDFRIASSRLAEYADCGPEEIEEFLHNTDLFAQLDTGAVTEHGVFDFIRKQYAISDHSLNIADIWCTIFTGEIPGIRNLLETLNPRYSLACLSNTNRTHYEYIDTHYPILDYFPAERRFLSYEMKLAKPDPEIYTQTLSRLGQQPESCIFIDDKTENVQAANRLGMTAILFQDTSVLIRELRELAIL